MLGDRPKLCCLGGGDGTRVSVEGDKFHFIGQAIAVNVDDGSDIPWFQTITGANNDLEHMFCSMGPGEGCGHPGRRPGIFRKPQRGALLKPGAKP